jgi:CubicO group peptidase (beta-lactamase class C family)
MRRAAQVLFIALAIGVSQAELRSGHSAGAARTDDVERYVRRELDALAQHGVLPRSGPGAPGTSARDLERLRWRKEDGAVDFRARDDARGKHAFRGSRSTEQPASTPRRPDRATVFVEIDRLVHDFMEREHVPGAAWGIILDGTFVHRGTAGVRERATSAPVTPDTVFRIASMTKSFTAMAVLKLRDEGRLALDDPVERHVPELRGLRYPTNDSPAITIRHLLTHSAGFPEDNPWGDQQLSVTEDEFSEMLRRGLPFSTTPGVAYEYSNYGYAILGRVITNVAKMPRPLGLSATTLDPTSVPADRLAHGYRWEGARWSEEPLLPDGAFGAMGGMLTSLDDLARYVAVYLDAWPPRDGPEQGPIARASLREMQQAWRARPAVVTRDAAGRPQLNAGGYGYGLRVTQTCEFEHVVAHTGGLPGFGSIMQWLPDYGAGFIAMGNRTYTGWGGVAAQALEILRRAGVIERRQPQPSDALRRARDEVSQLVIAWDDALADRIAAINLYRDRSKENRRQQIEALRAAVGACRPPDRFTFVENALRGTWTLDCERGDLDVTVTLAPTMPPLVQYLEVALSEPRVRSACR